MRSDDGRSSGRPLHLKLGLEAFDIAIDRGNRQHASLALVAQQAIPAPDIAVDRDLVPFLRVADIVDRHVVMLAPEERYGFESLARSQHVARGSLPMTLRHHPVL